MCPFCDCILDPSVLDSLGADIEESSGSAEWTPMQERRSDPPDAVILRDVNESQDISAVLGPGAQQGGATQNYLYYSATQQRLLPAAIPRRVSDQLTQPYTPYEAFVFQQIDGRRRVVDIQGLTRLSAEELSVSLLTLFDRGLIEIDGVQPRSGTTPPLRESSVAIQSSGAHDALPWARPQQPAKTGPIEPRPSTQDIDIEVHEADIEAVSATPPPAPPLRPSSARVAPPAQPPGPKIDPIRARKALKLYEQALEDLREGNPLSAQMNMKLALSFDPSNKQIERAFEELRTEGAAPKRVKRDHARELYDQATEAETRGQPSEAIRLLEAAIRISRQAAFLNRLGVLLAMKRRRYNEAQALIEEAIELSPDNKTYRHNLQQVLTMADSEAKNPNRRRRGLLGFFRR